MESVLEEVERGVPESVTEQECCKCNDTTQQSKSPDFPPLGQRHVVTVRVRRLGSNISLLSNKHTLFLFFRQYRAGFMNVLNKIH